MNDIVYENKFFRGARFLLFVFGLIPLLAPYELIIKNGWPNFSLFSIFSFIISFGALIISFAFIFGALFSRDEKVAILENQNKVTYEYSNLFVKNRKIEFGFSEVQSLDVRVNQWDSGADTFYIALKMRSMKKEIHLGAFFKEDIAREECLKLKRIILAR